MITKTTKAFHQRISKEIKRAAQAVAFYFFLEMQPVPAARPRVSRRGWTFYPKTYTQFKVHAENKIEDMGLPIVDQPCVLAVEMVAEKPKTGKLPSPRGDVDNYLKAIMDAMTKGNCWTDDDLVVSVLATKRYAEPDEEPGFHVTVHTIEKD